MLDLKPIEERLAGISAWPWREIDRDIFDANKRLIGRAIASPYIHCSGRNNASFFTKAPEIVRDLIAEVKRLKKEITRFEIEHSEEEGYFG